MARKIYYKVRIGKGSKRGTNKYLRTEFKKKRTAKSAAERYSHARVVKRRRATLKHHKTR